MAQNGIAKNISGVVLIGGSAGSLNGVLTLLTELNDALNIAVIIVLHRKPNSENLLVNLLATRTQWTVKEVEEKDELLPKHVYIAPADYHLLIEKNGSFSLDASEKIHFSRPSIDVTFESAAEVLGRSVVGILLSGANTDGTEGMRKIKECGGFCIVQEPGSAEVSIMPRQALNEVVIDKVLPTGQMADFINEMFIHG